MWRSDIYQLLALYYIHTEFTIHFSASQCLPLYFILNFFVYTTLHGTKSHNIITLRSQPQETHISFECALVSRLI